MIVEILKPDKIVLDLEGSFPEALDQLFQRSSFASRRVDLWSSLTTDDAQRYNLLDTNIAIPHLRVDGLVNPEIILGISASGVRLNASVIKIILLLATPEDQPAQHLQLLERISAFLPAIARDLLWQRDAAGILKTIAKGEEQAGRATYMNVTQEQVAFELQTDLDHGLAAQEARRRLDLYGPNLIRKLPRTPWHVMLLKNLFGFFAILLWLAALLCFVPGVDMPQLGTAILAVIFVNGLFSFFQEYKSDRAIEALQGLLVQKCRVLRNGKVSEVESETLVPGDVIVLDQGDAVPADARLIEAFEVEVDNSALTGESTSARRYKSDQPILLHGKFLWIEFPNIVFAGTSMVKGQARAVVFGTGMKSEIGKIAGMTQQIRTEESPLQKQLRTTVLAIACLAGGLGLVLLFLGWLVAGLSFVEAFVFFIGMFVANVPEGLLPTVTLALAMGVSRMAKRQVLVKDLRSVETLGCTTVICCDKTGTLTQNVMMVNQICVDGRVVEVSGAGYEPKGKFSVAGSTLSLEEITHWPALRRLLECSYICNNAQIEKSPAGYRIVGDLTEGALMVVAEKASLRGIHQRLHVNPFESVRKRMSVVVKLEGHKEKVAYVKGAPLETLERCDRVLREGELRPLNETERRRIIAENDILAGQGLRILALAFRDDAELQEQNVYEQNRIEDQLVFLGLTAMSDPIRPEVPVAIQACHAAGIRIVMITGDYALTAASIGHQIGLGNGSSFQVFPGTKVSELDDSQLRSILERGDSVFARVSPEHKLRIVTLLKEMGEIVAVTGDGVNDAPALKKAHIGVAMGVRGNDVAKESADMILTDDNFSSIVAAIEEGRAIFENIKRFMAYILSSNPQEMYPYILWMLLPDVPLAMTVMGVLAVDVGTDLIPAMGLGIEPPEKGIMERPPRSRDERLLSLKFVLRSYFVQGSLLALSCYATYCYMGWVLGYWKPGRSLTAMPASPPGLQLEQASTAYLQTLTAYFFPTVTTQIANVLCRRSWKTSLFARDFLSAERRGQLLQGIAGWRPRRYEARVSIDYRLSHAGQIDIIRAFFALCLGLILLPLKLLNLLVSRLMLWLEEPVLIPLAARTARFLEVHYILLNLISNPLINLGILVELFLCYLFFYSPLAHIYFFAPVPWHVYIFAFHGTVLLLIFEEVKKYYRRRGHALEFLG